MPIPGQAEFPPQPELNDPLEMAPLRARLIEEGFTEEELDASDAEPEDEEESGGTLVALLAGGLALGLVVLFLTGKK